MQTLDDPSYPIWTETSPDNAPYLNSQTFMEDLLCLISLLCSVYHELQQDADISYQLRSISTSKEQLETTMLARSTKLLPVERIPEITQATAHIQTRIHASLALNISLPFIDLVRMFSLNDFEAFCVLMAICTDLDRRFEGIFYHLQHDSGISRATLGLACDLFSLLQSNLSEKNIYAMLDRQQPINELLLTDWQNNENRSVLLRPLSVSKELLYFLTNIHSAEIDDLGGSVRIMSGTEAPILWNQDKIDIGVEFIEHSRTYVFRNELNILYLFGSSGTGKSFSLSQMAKKLGLRILEINAEVLFQQPMRETLLQIITLKCLLNGYIPCLDRLILENPQTATILQQSIRIWRKYFPLVIFCADKSWSFPKNLEITCKSMGFPMPNAKQRYAFWKHFMISSKTTLSEAELSTLASCYRLSLAEITTICSSLARNTAYQTKALPIWQRIADILREEACSRLNGLAQYVVSPFEWKDLHLPDEASKTLRSACTRIQHRYQVNENWGFARRLTYGQGLSILFYGPPGTGKTMAAQVLSHEVGIDLFRVDLSQIIDKYIGETEKNLRKLFDTAESVNCILFFDEADALFSKRTEIEDSKDKYANVETAYLLQRIEQFPGITILATNNARNFDEAFRRRMTYFINIPMPDQQARLHIWENVFPAELPVDPSVNFEELAEKFQFSGSSIKSVAVSAAYAAAAIGKSVTRQNIFEALQIEYLKTGKILHITEYPF